MTDLLVDALATYRLTRLLQRDAVARPIRARVAAAVRDGRYPEWVLELSERCPWCASWWVGLAVVAAGRAAPRAWAPVARALALSAVAGLVAENLD